MSSESDSDEEFVPGEPEQVSEEGSADEETDLQYEKEQEIKTKKRKAAQESNSNNKRRTRNAVKEPTPEPEEKKPETNLDPVEEKKREEDLWAKFLAGTGSASKAPAKETPVKQAEKSEIPNKVAEPKAQAKTNSIQDDIKAREQRIFQFAGETIVVENNIIKEKIKTAEAPATVSKLIPQRSRGSSGLADVLGQLNKKNSLSTLDKSKLDWETYKKDQDINEEIQSHNKGKHGYLERQDFLERADHRQYEIERDMRLSRRSNR
ncbi:craniofacial development protein 1 [Cydia strobilella]|uniref:craniofacial development protein 1 n=1 Tax=Cydia strobilella TaxID=1100964 RepID=UPI003006DE21